MGCEVQRADGWLIAASTAYHAAGDKRDGRRNTITNGVGQGRWCPNGRPPPPFGSRVIQVAAASPD